MYQKIENELRENILNISIRLKNKTYSCLILGVIATEMFFRGKINRFVEYICWILLWIIGSSRVEFLSLGISQIQLRHWKKQGFIKSYKPTINNLLAVSNFRNNYNACKQYLDDSSIGDSSSLIDIGDKYTGKSRKYYLQILQQSLMIANKIASSHIVYQ